MFRNILGVLAFFVGLSAQAADAPQYFEFASTVVVSTAPNEPLETKSVVASGVEAQTIRYHEAAQLGIKSNFQVLGVDAEGNINVSVAIDFASEGREWKEGIRYKAAVKPGASATVATATGQPGVKVTFSLTPVAEAMLRERLGGAIPAPKACAQKSKVFTQNSAAAQSSAGCCSTIDCSTRPIQCCGVVWCCDGGCCCIAPPSGGSGTS
jgi:hypothetical protein